MTQRWCKCCGGWHSLDAPWPDNCLPGRNMARANFATPVIWRDGPDYQSPIDGKWISGRTERREDLKKHDCIPWEPGIGQKAGAKDRTPGKYRNPRFAAKRGLPLSEEGHERAKARQKEKA